MLLHALQESITNFSLFWTEHEKEYLAQAAKIAETVARSLRGTREEKAWQETCAAIANGVTTTVKDAALIITLPSLTANASVTITRGVLRAWVEAGERNEEGAKRITADDRALLAKGDLGMKQLLSRLGNAYYSNSFDYGDLRKAINQWASETSGGTTAPVKGIPPEVVHAIKAQWDEWFGIIVRSDLKEWIGKQVRLFVRSL